MNMLTPLLLDFFFFETFCLFLEANPEKFNSRFRNKMFYAGVSAAQFINVIMFYYMCNVLLDLFLLIILLLPLLHSIVN